MKPILPSRIVGRSWIQWSLRSLLILMLPIGVAFAWWGAKLRKDARLKEAVRLMAASPGWLPSDECDPIALVRAVNALHALGKNDAIEALRRFAEQYPSNHGANDKHEVLRVIIPLLFVRTDPEDRYPSASRAGDRGTYRLDHTEWPFLPSICHIEGDIPFQRVRSRVFFTGAMDDFSYAINWSEQCGRFRSTPLRPADSPFEAADRLIDEVVKSDQSPAVAFDVIIKRHFREQTLRAISHLLAPEEVAKYRWKEVRSPNQWHDLANDDHWAQLKKECDAIRWSPERQTYIGRQP